MRGFPFLGRVWFDINVTAQCEFGAVPQKTPVSFFYSMFVCS